MPAVKKEFNVSADPELHGIMGRVRVVLLLSVRRGFARMIFARSSRSSGALPTSVAGTSFLNLWRRVRKNRSGFSCRTVATTIAGPEMWRTIGFTKTSV